MLTLALVVTSIGFSPDAYGDYRILAGALAAYDGSDLDEYAKLL